MSIINDYYKYLLNLFKTKCPNLTYDHKDVEGWELVRLNDASISDEEESAYSSASTGSFSIYTKDGETKYLIKVDEHPDVNDEGTHAIKTLVLLHEFGHLNDALVCKNINQQLSTINTVDAEVEEK